MYEQVGMANLMSHITMVKIRRSIATVSNLLREICGPHGGEYAHDYHLECDAITQASRPLAASQRKFLLHFQGMTVTMKEETGGYAKTLKLYGVTPQKTIIFINIC
jgi:hypothetical protein